jgi:hypothetical protein
MSNPENSMTKKSKTLTKEGYAERIGIHAYRADALLQSAGYSVLAQDQWECLQDPTRADEAIGMVEHLQARCDLPIPLTDKIVALLRGFGEDYGS